jgi:hypothetical protein
MCNLSALIGIKSNININIDLPSFYPMIKKEVAKDRFLRIRRRKMGKFKRLKYRKRDAFKYARYHRAKKSKVCLIN